jgi:hypothetical protein
MEFEIDFNRHNDDRFLIDRLGAWVDRYDDFDAIKIEIKDLEELEMLLAKVNHCLGGEYSAIVSFDPPAIFLDDKV